MIFWGFFIPSASPCLRINRNGCFQFFLKSFGREFVVWKSVVIYSLRKNREKFREKVKKDNLKRSDFILTEHFAGCRYGLPNTTSNRPRTSMLDSRLCGYMPIHRGYLANKVMVREGDVVLKDLKLPVPAFFWKSADFFGYSVMDCASYRIGRDEEWLNQICCFE